MDKRAAAKGSQIQFPSAGREFLSWLTYSLLVLLVSFQLTRPASLHAAERSSVQIAQRFAQIYASQQIGDPTPVILFDNTHAETAGNADWVIGGGYSDWAEDLTRYGYRVEEHASGEISPEVLSRCQIFVLPEPNTPLTTEEQKALVDFVAEGGGLLLIGDHEGADRNNDGWDSVRIFNAFCEAFGFRFDEKWFDDDPMGGSILQSPLTFRVQSMGAWGSTSISIVDPSLAEGQIFVSHRNGGNPFLVSATYGRGRVVAIGDSSPFDDGTGNPRDRLHDGYNRLLFDIPQMGLNIAHWLVGRSPEKISRAKDADIKWWSEDAKAQLPVVIDLGRGNYDADRFHLYRTQLEKDGLSVYYTRERLTVSLLHNVRLLVVSDPGRPLEATEIQAISKRVASGMSLLLMSRSDFRDRGHPKNSNAILEGIGSSWRFNDDQVIDPSSNAGKPWMVLATAVDQGMLPGVSAVRFLSGSSLIRVKASSGRARNARILVRGNPTSQNRDQDGNGDAVLYDSGPEIVLCAMEEIGSGRIALLGDTCFAEWAYGKTDRNGAPIEHQTPLFNLLLTHRLCCETDGE